MRKCIFPIIVIVCFLNVGYTSPAGINNITTTLHFKNWVGNKELVLFDENYTNSFGEPFTVNKFRYYISNIVVTDVNDKETAIANSYYLINEADSLSKTIQLSTAATIKSISFLVGVDSVKNIGGVQTGSLDPMNGMFWTWNSGYVFAKLEGQSDSSHAPAHGLTWDVGGFRQKENALRRIKLTIEKMSANNTITINANILKWFDGVHPIKISQLPTCHQAGKLAMQLADNYSTMFSITQ